MVDIYKKGDGSKTTDGSVPVVTPTNIGKGFKWDAGTFTYNVNVTSSNLKVSTGLTFVGDALSVLLSKQEGNLLQLLKDGLYYGVKAPADLANLYVDAINGVDQHPDDVDGAGSKAKPLKTFAYANKIAREGTIRKILLHTEQEHICSVDNYFWLKAGRISVVPYGPAADAAVKEGGGDYTTSYGILSDNGKAPILVFKGVINKVHAALTKETTYPDLSCFRITIGTNIQFNGIILRNDLSVNITRHPEAKTNVLKYGVLSRVLSDVGGKCVINRCKLECVGTPRFDNFDGFNVDSLSKTVDGAKISALGFFSPEAGEYNVLNTKMQDAMPCMFIAHSGWGQSVNSSLTVSLATTYTPEKFAKRIYGAKIDTQNGVRILLAPNSDISASLF